MESNKNMIFALSDMVLKVQEKGINVSFEITSHGYLLWHFSDNTEILKYFDFGKKMKYSSFEESMKYLGGLLDE